jgi:hypothetical protein
MAAEAKSGNLVISEISTPEEMDPGEEGVAEVTVENLATVITPWDGDRCVGDTTTVGYKYRIVVRVGGETYESATSCLDNLTGKNIEEQRVTFQAPDSPGTVDVEARIELPQTGNRSDWLSSRVEVYGEGDDEPADPPDDDGGDGEPGDTPDWLADLLGDGGGVGTQIQLVLVVILLIAVLYSAGQLATFNVGGS